ncbi:hypothetical protein NP493_1712g00056 [Ridgeia piscesae]|uniref:G-protein coupled receptors family 1 profile domain-containing protein n=1 Tax=Ridgeia piscesae TaxID=27915 RepID=A0AAD9JUS8_RIDPI|nr:hypothetical protein NP493_1712g00056 [Ridgeia piscesae]
MVNMTPHPPTYFFDGNSTWQGLDLNATDLFSLPRDSGFVAVQLAVRYLHIYYVPTVSLLGIACNAFGLATLLSRYRQTSAVRYMSGLLVADSLFLSSLFYLWLVELNVPLYRMAGWCQLATFVHDASDFIARWYVVCLAVDCYVSAAHPRTAVTYCTKLVSSVVIGVVTVIAVVVYLNTCLTIGVVVIGPKVICAPLQQFASALSDLGKVDVFVNKLLPFSAILVLFCATSTGSMRQRRRRRLRHTADFSPADEIHPRDLRETAGAMAQVCAYVVCTLPGEIVASYEVLHQIGNIVTQLSLEHFLLQQMLYYPQYTRQALNIVVLVIFWPRFAKACRRRVAEVIRRTPCGRRKDTRLPTEQILPEPLELTGSDREIASLTAVQSEHTSTSCDGTVQAGMSVR